MSRHWVTFILVTATIAGGLTAALFLTAGLSNNNQGEFLDPVTGQADWGAITALGLSGFLPPFLLIAVPSLVTAGLIGWLQASPTSKSS